MKRFTLFTLILLWTFGLSAQLTPIGSFGSNPGNLNMYVHIPNNMPSNAPLILVLHGCTQSASAYASESDWNNLADEYGFYVIYAEQKSANNSSQCFNWFETGDINRGYGEAASLKSMTDYMKSNFSVDNSQVFVTGFSAGGAMTTAMLAAYPDVFSGGAVMSGLPYKVATSSNQAFMAMFGNVNQSPGQLGNSVRSASSYSGSWPKVGVFHGTSDYTVYYMNQNEIMEQWTNVHGADQTADATTNSFQGNPSVSKQEYHNGSGETVVVTYSFNGMGHTIAIDPGSGETQGGNTGSYATDVNFYSSYWAADFLGLIDGTTGGGNLAAPTNLSASAASSSQIDLNWTDNATNETSYLIQRSSSSSGNFSTITTLGANSTSYIDESLIPSSTYYYKVLASDGTNTAASSVAMATTQPSGGNDEPTIVTIEQTSGNGILTYTSTHDMGQSFTSIADGDLIAIEIKLVYALSNSTLKVFSGNTVSGTPIYEQTGVSAGTGWQEIALNSPLELTNNQTYTFQLTDASLRYSYANVYSGGSLWYDNINYSVFDVPFVVSISTSGNGSRMGIRSQISDGNPIIYPNPTTEHLYIQMIEEGSLEIYHINGQKVWKQQLQRPSNQINVSRLVPGVYQVLIRSGNQLLKQKLIVE